jgi:mannose-1-phosphate guanylyltransferase
VVNKPLLQWIFERLAKNNINDVILAVNGLTEFYIKKQRIPKNGLRIKYSIDPSKTPLGTAGPVKKAEKLLGNSEPFLVLNGDVFEDVNYGEIIEKHQENHATATIALCKVEDPTRYGVAEIAADNRITRFIEKPAKGEAPTNLINAGIYVLNQEILSYIPKGKKVSMEREIFPKLAKQGKLCGYTIHGLWIDIGKPEEYLQTNRTILDKLTKTQKLTSTKYETKTPVALDKGVTIGEKSVIGPYAILGKNVTIGKNVHISNTVVFPDVKIDDNASINGAIIGENAEIGKKVKITQGCIIADQAKIKDSILLTNGTAVCPAKEVTENTLKTKIIC